MGPPGPTGLPGDVGEVGPAGRAGRCNCSLPDVFVHRVTVPGPTRVSVQLSMLVHTLNTGCVSQHQRAFAVCGRQGGDCTR
jgi:hypothetical protein